MTGLIRILVVDDHAVVRAGCRQLLELSGGFFVAEAASAAEALRLAAELRPGLVMLDLNLPDGSGLDLIPQLLAGDAAIRILVFTMHEDPAYVARALEGGAHGFVTKGDDPDTIVEAARQVASGEFFLSRPVAQNLALMQSRRRKDPLAPLTRREREVLLLYGQGKTLADIAAGLGISYKTAANSCTSIKTKLGLANTSELMRIAVAYGATTG
ncbi:MAG TPA: response regulator transcription factor [Patescibacteria group bacterium]|nr:response regulator transcription factor [Patescibacteria group bacterium]